MIVGYIKHEAVIVTTNRCRDGGLPDIDAFRRSLPAELRPLVVGPVQSLVNDYHSYVFLPDGSNERWDESDGGDVAREQFKDLFRTLFEDGWTHVAFGGDYGFDHGTHIVEAWPPRNQRSEGSMPDVDLSDDRARRDYLAIGLPAAIREVCRDRLESHVIDEAADVCGAGGEVDANVLRGLCEPASLCADAVVWLLGLDQATSRTEWALRGTYPDGTNEVITGDNGRDYWADRVAAINVPDALRHPNLYVSAELVLRTITTTPQGWTITGPWTPDEEHWSCPT